MQHLLPKLSLAFLVAVLELPLVCLQGRMYNLCVCNCHHMVVHMLNRLHYQGKDSWEVVGLVRTGYLHSRLAAVVTFYLSYAGHCTSTDTEGLCLYRLLGSLQMLLTLTGLGY